MTAVANNLPGYMQYLDLIRDCIELFSLEPMPPNEVETEHEFNSDVNLSYSYAGEDNRHHRTHSASEKFELAEYNCWLEQGRKRRSNKKKRELESQKRLCLGGNAVADRSAGLKRSELEFTAPSRARLKRGRLESGRSSSRLWGVMAVSGSCSQLRRNLWPPAAAVMRDHSHVCFSWKSD
jgi:hypothetical protein